MLSVELYWSPASCARIPFIVLEEAGALFTVHVFNRYLGDHQTPEYRALNPKEKVPTLVLDDWVITENPVIQTVLARYVPEARLLPTGDERVVTEALSTMAWFASGLQPAVARQRVPGVFSDDQAWLFGDSTIVDAYILWLWFRAVGSGMDSAPFPRCDDHARRTEARPSVATVLDREELELARFDEAGTVPDTISPFQVGCTPAPLTASGERT